MADLKPEKVKEHASNALKIDNIEDYNITNVTKSFLELANNLHCEQ